MLQLAYISSARLAVDQALLEEILAVSRRNNARCGVTGLLVSGGKRFLQVLEGPDQAVLDTYARIRGDARHFAFVLITSQKVEARAFGTWSMAHERAIRTEGEDLEGLVAALTRDVADPNLRAQFSGFARLHQKAA